MLGNFDLNSPELKALVQNTSENELVEIMLDSLKQLYNNPEQLKQFLSTLPPMVRQQFGSMRPSDEVLRPMAKMSAQMLRSQITGGSGTENMLMHQAQEMMKDPSMGDFLTSMTGLPGGTQMGDQEPPAEWGRLMNRGFAAMTADDSAEAEDCFLQALQLVEKDVPDKLCMYETLQHLTSFYLHEERYDEAEPFLQMWIKRGEKLFGAEHVILTGAYVGLATVREQQKKTSDAEVLYNRALSIADKQLAAEPDALSGIRENIGTFYERSKLYNKSDLLFQSALALKERAGINVELAEQLLRYGLILVDRGGNHTAKARQHIERALRIKEQKLQADDPDLLRSRTALGAMECALGNHDEAEKILMPAVAALEKVVDDKEDLIWPYEQLKKLYEARGNKEEAEQVSKRLSELE